MSRKFASFSADFAMELGCTHQEIDLLAALWNQDFTALLCAFQGFHP
jgi:hypothetical protein